MNALPSLITRNCKLFFKDKGMFLTALVTPLILLVLYATFLANVYRDSFLSGIGDQITVSASLIDGMVAGQLFTSLLAVCCVTVSFCANLLMVQDKVTGARKDLTMTPVSPAVLALGYYLSTVISTLAICLIATFACFAYMANVGWYLTVRDVALVLVDVVLLVLFGTALSSCLNLFLSTQGQKSAVESIVSSMYGFLCGAYMPISQFGEGLQRVISFLPGTYGTSLLRNHALRGVFAEMEALGFPMEAIDGIRDAIDCNLYFFGRPVEVSAMFVVLAASVAGLIALYILLNRFRKDAQ